MENLNASQLDVDAFGDTDAQVTEDYESDVAYQVLSYAKVAIDVIELVFFLCVILADVILIYVICRFRKLKTKTNRYILHYAVFNILYFITLPVFYLLFQINYSLSRSVVINDKLLVQVESLCLVMNYLFTAGLCFDWLAASFNSRLGSTLQTIYSCSILILYGAGFGYILLRCIFFFTLPWKTTHTDVIVIYLLVLVFTLALNFVRHPNRTVDNSESDYSLTVATVIVLCWLPACVTHLLSYLDLGHIVHLIIYFAQCISEWIIYSSTIIILFILSRANKYFKMAFDRTFKCSFKNYFVDEDNLDESDTEDDMDSVVINAVEI